MLSIIGYRNVWSSSLKICLKLLDSENVARRRRRRFTRRTYNVPGPDLI